MEVKTINGYDIKDEKAIRTYDTVALMQADSKLSEGQHVKTRGYYSINDEGGCEYYITNDEIVSEYQEILSNGLYATLVNNGKVNIKQFGAKGDGETDDTLSIQSALDYDCSDVFIPEGTFMVSTIVISKPMNLQGASKEKSIIKSIPNNVNEGVLQITNDGLNHTEVSNLYINGNRSNNSLFVNGIQLWCTDSSLDRYTYLHDIIVRYCNGNGIYIGSDTSKNMKELRLNNIQVGNNNENGIYVKNSTDSYFFEISSHRNLKNGFLITGGNHKILNCKAFWNGEGIEGEFESIKRLPSTAFTQTSDESYNSEKTYYTRTGTDTQNSWYVFSEFTGDSFEQDVTYYELTTQYQKRYPGFNLRGARNVISGCESQENFGDGFYTYASNLNLISIFADTNGILIDEQGNMVSYASKELTQLYYGIYIRSGRKLNVIGTFINSRVDSIGKCQKAPMFIDENNYTTYRILSDENVNDFVMYQGCNMSTSMGICNNEENIYDYPLTNSIFPNNNPTLSFYSSSGYESYLRKVGNRVYFKFTINDSSGNIVTSTDSRTLFYIPQGLRPSEHTFFTAYLTNNNGNQAYDICNFFISKSGTVAVRVNELPSTDVKGVHVQGCYIVKER